ncbi:MAG: sugar phosphate isomerase/epimerase [Planctomycetota bacterium]
MIPLSRLAVQLFTVREFCKDGASLTTSLRKLRAIGFGAVQVSGVGPIEPAEIRRICAGEGMTICATHEASKRIIEETDAIADRLDAMGCALTAYPHPHVPLTNLAEVRALAAALDVAGAKLKARGITLCYHNHDMEFRRVAGKPVLEWLYDLTEPGNLQGEPDTYWVQRGGGDPATWCRKLAGRLPIIHLKDFAYIVNAAGEVKQAELCMVGDGNLDWAGILSAARDAGCQWYTIELDRCDGDPFVHLANGYNYIRNRLGAA